MQSLYFSLDFDWSYGILQDKIYSDTDLFLLCFAIDNPESLENIENKWMPKVRHFCPKGIAFSQLLLTSYLCM